jgi:hypothetical protein
MRLNRIPSAVLVTEPADAERWVAEARGAVDGLLAAALG